MTDPSKASAPITPEDLEEMKKGEQALRQVMFSHVEMRYGSEHHELVGFERTDEPILFSAFRDLGRCLAEIERLRELLMEAKQKLASGSWAANRTGYTHTAASIDLTYSKIDALYPSPPEHDA
jgi:hypothetical protein